MKNRIITYSNLSDELKKAFRTWLNMAHREIVTFPFKGRDTEGYIFDHEQQQYLVVMSAKQRLTIPNVLEIEQIDLNASIEDL